MITGDFIVLIIIGIGIILLPFAIMLDEKSPDSFTSISEEILKDLQGETSEPIE